MTRLNHSSRAQIVRELIDHRFGEEATEIREARAALADTLYTRWRKAQRVDPLTLPVGWLPAAATIHASISGVVCGLRFDGEDPHAYLSADITQPVPFTFKNQSRPLLVVDATDPFAIEHAAVEERASRHKAERNKAEHATRAAVNSFHTVEALLKAWPEIETIITIPGKRPATLLPVIQTAELNALLGLTKENVDAV